MSIDPDTSHITINLVFFCLRRLNESLTIPPPVLQRLRKSSPPDRFEPRLAASQRRLDAREPPGDSPRQPGDFFRLIGPEQTESFPV